MSKNLLERIVIPRDEDTPALELTGLGRISLVCSADTRLLRDVYYALPHHRIDPYDFWGRERWADIENGILTANERIIGLDQPYARLHYTQHKGFWRVVLRASRESETQIVATVQSIEAIAAAHAVCGDDLRYIRLDVSPSGEVSQIVYDYAMLGAALAEGIEVR